MEFHREELDDFVSRQAEEVEMIAKDEHENLSCWSVNVLQRSICRR